MESVNPQSEPEPCLVVGMEFLHALRKARQEEVEITKAILAPESPFLHILQPNENFQTEYWRTYVDDHSY